MSKLLKKHKIKEQKYIWEKQIMDKNIKNKFGITTATFWKYTIYFMIIRNLLFFFNSWKNRMLNVDLEYLGDVAKQKDMVLI